MAQAAKKTLLPAIIGPGILVAATGVGAGDLATATFAGSKLGVLILWAVVVGAFVKFVLNEGLTRWQLATGETLLEGALGRLGRPAQYIFLVYLVVWTFMVAAALMSACGVAAQAILPIADDPATGKITFGIILSIAGIVMVRAGGYRLFEKVMGLCIGIMFVTVVLTAILLRPDLGSIVSGLLWPSIPDVDGAGLAWTIALIGGVGGTVTVLCYGYWIREEGRLSVDDLRSCRLDLGVAYVMTAIFGVAMVIIGSTIEVEGKGAGLIVKLADSLGRELGVAGKWIFLVGAFGAIFSSLLGVWQSVPYLFADLWRMIGGGEARGSTGAAGSSSLGETAPYRWYLYGMASLPMLGLWVGFARMQKLYAIVGALFLPMLALVLLLLNGRSAWVGERYRNHPVTSVFLAAILLFFAMAGWMKLR